MAQLYNYDEEDETKKRLAFYLMHGVGRSNPSGPPPPEPIGTIQDDSFDGTLDDYTIVGTGISQSAGGVTMTGNPTLFSSALTFSKSTSAHKITCLEKWKQRVSCTTPGTLGGTTFGIGIGIRSLNGYDPFSTIVRWAWDNAAGNVYLYTKDTITGQLVAGTTFTPTINTTYVLEIERAKNVITFSIYNAAGNTQLYTTSFTINITSANSAQAHNTGRFAIYNFGGTTIINQWTITSDADKYVDIIGIGDSNMYGMYAAANSARYTEAAFTGAGKSFEILAGIADRTAELVSRLPEIVALAPTAVYVNVGRNDIANSVGTSTWQANIDTIISTLETAGIEVILGTPIASNVDVSGVATYVNGKSNTKYDFYALTKAAGNFTLNTTYNSGIGDGIHLNVAGHTACTAPLQGIL
jgi:lysophospholipase L1-like esterase